MLRYGTLQSSLATCTLKIMRRKDNVCPRENGRRETTNGSGVAAAYVFGKIGSAWQIQSVSSAWTSTNVIVDKRFMKSQVRSQDHSNVNELELNSSGAVVDSRTSTSAVSNA
jgi:hypothetical protein